MTPEKDPYIDTVPLTSRTAVGEKLEMLDHNSNKHYNKSKFNQAISYGDFDDYY
jgi:hypothetical protein